MQELSSYVGGRWLAGTGNPQTLLNPATEEPLALASSEGIDFAAVSQKFLMDGEGIQQKLTGAQPERQDVIFSRSSRAS